MMGSLVLDKAEDLSDEGLTGWIDELESLENEVNTLRSRAITSVDIILCGELDRFVQEKKYQAQIQQPFLKSLSAYLHLVVAGLLPFDLSPDLPDVTEEPLGLRLQAAENWLALAARRQANGILAVTEAEVKQAVALATTIEDLVRRKHITSQVLNLSTRVCEQLRRWRPSQSERDNIANRWQPEHIDYLLSHCLGTGKSLAWWQEKLVERLVVEIETLNKSEAMGNSLQLFTERTDWDDNRWGSLDLESGENYGVVDSHSVIAWFEIVYRRLREVVIGSYLQQPAPPVPIQIAPPIVQFLVIEALFLPFPLGTATGRLLLSPLILGTKPLTRRNRVYLAVMAAHELCPGHHEQFWHCQRAILAPYLDILQSSIGLEGWALVCEKIVAEYDPSTAAVVSYHAIRRLMPAALVLTQLQKGREAANRLLRMILGRCPALVSEAGRSGRISETSLPYAVGLVETEYYLAQLHERLGPEATWLETRERYLDQGLLTPASTAHIAALVAGQESLIPKESS